ncbi:preprotein translocase subunit SecE [Anaerotignum sp.]|uniref:preprotein translocase subunit SecE n=1 Tax=Anaerotignum sp. TaxID=2039241 RepID=UPI0027154713|nr:preprotein translocase subunit SecE [Anaerotignum sp.]
MEEKQNTNQTNETKQAKPKQVKKNNDRDGFADYKAEFKKIIWPSRPEIAKKTFTVIVTSLILGVIIFCMDSVFSAGYSAIIGLLG